MKKLAVNEAVAAVRSADGKDAMQMVLEQCTKAVMVQVYEEVTGQTAEFKKSLKKAKLAQEIAKSIQSWIAYKALKSKRFEDPTMLYELTAITDRASRRAAREENVTAILSCETEGEVRSMLNTISVISMLMTAQRVIFLLGGEVPIFCSHRDAARRLAKQIMRAKVNSDLR